MPKAEWRNLKYRPSLRFYLSRLIARPHVIPWGTVCGGAAVGLVWSLGPGFVLASHTTSRPAGSAPRHYDQYEHVWLHPWLCVHLVVYATGLIPSACGADIVVNINSYICFLMPLGSASASVFRDQFDNTLLPIQQDNIQDECHHWPWSRYGDQRAPDPDRRCLRQR